MWKFETHAGERKRPPSIDRRMEERGEASVHHMVAFHWCAESGRLVRPPNRSRNPRSNPTFLAKHCAAHVAGVRNAALPALVPCTWGRVPARVGTCWRVHDAWDPILSPVWPRFAFFRLDFNYDPIFMRIRTYQGNSRIFEIVSGK